MRAEGLALGLADRCMLVRGDALDYNFVPDSYDSALAGFFLSHIPEQQEAALFESIRTMLRPSGQLLIVDSAWTERRRDTTKGGAPGASIERRHKVRNLQALH